MSLDWDTKKMVKRLGRERYDLLTTDPKGRDGPRERWGLAPGHHGFG